MIARLLFRRLLMINLSKILTCIIEWEHERNASGKSVEEEISFWNIVIPV